MEAAEQVINGDIGTSAVDVSSIISRDGDLLGEMWLDVKMSAQMNTNDGVAGKYLTWINNTGHAFINEASIELGGQVLDRQFGQWLDIYNELTDHHKKE